MADGCACLSQVLILDNAMHVPTVSSCASRVSASSIMWPFVPLTFAMSCGIQFRRSRSSILMYTTGMVLQVLSACGLLHAHPFTIVLGRHRAAVEARCTRSGELKLFACVCQLLCADCGKTSVLALVQGVQSLGRQCTPHGCLVWCLARCVCMCW